VAPNVVGPKPNPPRKPTRAKSRPSLAPNPFVNVGFGLIILALLLVFLASRAAIFGLVAADVAPN
jgi:hypothetical protein